MKTEIDKFKPCDDALEFRKKYKTFRGAWNNCPRGDWMLWIAQRLDVDIRVLTLAKGYCAKTVIHLMKDQRSKDAVKAAIDFGRGRINEDQLASYAWAAWAARAARAASYARDAWAARAAWAASYARDARAAWAARAASYARDAWAANQKETADICRKYLTKAVMEKIKTL